MGLDQYANYTTPKNDTHHELACWRKHNRLQGWMEALWLTKGGKGEFNCVDLELTAVDIDLLEKVITDKALPETRGFFFGGDSYEGYEEDGYKEDDLKFIEDAREQLEAGNKVFYSCWW